jgi:hypothetical protein
MKPFKFSKKKREYIKWSKNITEVRTFPEAPQASSQPASPQVEMDDATAQEMYANMAALTHTETEFVMDFIFLQPNQPKGKVRTRIISTPGHTKRLCAALRENLKRYEARFGPIKTQVNQ